MLDRHRELCVSIHSSFLFADTLPLLFRHRLFPLLSVFLKGSWWALAPEFGLHFLRIMPPPILKRLVQLIQLVHGGPLTSKIVSEISLQPNMGQEVVKQKQNRLPLIFYVLIMWGLELLEAFCKANSGKTHHTKRIKAKENCRDVILTESSQPWTPYLWANLNHWHWTEFVTCFP